jgi:8-oxo-dGTP diphosphatase
VTSTLDQQQVDELVTRTHGQGIHDLAAAALIEHGGRFLLVEKPAPDFGTTVSSWVLPTITVRAGETVTAALERGLSQYCGFDTAQIDRYLSHTDHNEDDGHTVRVFAFAVTVKQPDSICQAGCLGHFWIDTICRRSRESTQLGTRKRTQQAGRRSAGAIR